MTTDSTGIHTARVLNLNVTVVCQTVGRRDKATAVARACPRARAQCQLESVMETAAPALYFFHELYRNAPPSNRKHGRNFHQV